MQNKTSQRLLLQLIHWRTNNVTTIDQEEHKLKLQIYIWNPMTTRLHYVNIDCIISVEFLSLRSIHLSCETSLLAARSEKRQLYLQAIVIPVIPLTPSHFIYLVTLVIPVTQSS